MFYFALLWVILTTFLQTSNAFTIPSPLLHLSIGAISGGAGAFAFYPFDYVKSQIQSTSELDSKYNNGWETLVDTILTEGPQRLYKGVGVQVLGAAPEKSLKLGINDVVLDLWASPGAAVPALAAASIPLWWQIFAGCVAGTCQVVATSPLEVVKINMQLSEKTFVQVIRDVGGIAGLFVGAEACIVRDVTFTAICFPLYTALTESIHQPFLAGAISGMVASAIATPADLVKTRMLVDMDPVTEAVDLELSTATASSTKSTRSAASVFQLENRQGITATATVTRSTVESASKTTSFSSNPQGGRRNAWQVSQDIVETEGWSALFAGVTERGIGAIPRFGVTLGIHDFLEHFCTSHHLFPAT